MLRRSFMRLAASCVILPALRWLPMAGEQMEYARLLADRLQAYQEVLREAMWRIHNDPLVRFHFPQETSSMPRSHHWETLS